MTELNLDIHVSPNPDVDFSDKGQFAGHCNRRACKRPGAFFYNRGSMSHYCIHCALDLGLDSFNVKEQLFDTELLKILQEGLYDVDFKWPTLEEVIAFNDRCRNNPHPFS